MPRHVGVYEHEPFVIENEQIAAEVADPDHAPPPSVHALDRVGIRRGGPLKRVYDWPPSSHIFAATRRAEAR